MSNNIFFGLNIGRSSLLSHQKALDVTGHNLANIQTENYSRQRISLTQSQPTITAQGSQGSGVKIEHVERMQSSYIERQIAKASVRNGYDAARADGLDELQSLLGEPSDDGLSAALNEFWNAWESLSMNPTDAAIRSQVVDRSMNLATVYNRKIEGMTSLEDTFNDSISDSISEVNALSKDLADMNSEIAKAEAGGFPANDMRDQRDKLVRDLSVKIGIEMVSDGSYVNIKLPGDGPYIIHRNKSFEITGIPDADNHLSSFMIEPSPIEISGGELGALVELRDEDSLQLREKLSMMMATIVDRVNDLHSKGTDRDGQLGQQLFVWDGEAASAVVVPSSGVSRVSFDDNLEVGTHRVEVVAVDDALVEVDSLSTLTPGLGSIEVSQTGGAYSGAMTLNQDYHVRVISANVGAANLDGLGLQLFRGEEAIGDSVSISGAAPTTVSWTDVDGMTLEASIIPGADGPFIAGQRSGGLATTGWVSLDGASVNLSSAPIDLSTQNNIQLFGGGNDNYMPGGSATVTFSGASFSGASFTVYGPSAELALNGAVALDPNKLAAAETPLNGSAAQPGSGENARMIADLSAKAIFEDVKEPPSGFFSEIVLTLGSKSRDADMFMQASSSVLLQLDAQRENMSGVNVDEEMIQLIQYQRGFEAAARFITTVDGMIDTLINRVGLVGR